MKAIVLAGGKGTRLKPYTTALPKPLMPIGDKPVLELVLLHLRKYGITNVTLAVNHLAELIRAFFGDGSRWNITLRYSVEDRPLSTVGPLRILDEELPGTFIVMNGDVITDLDMLELLRSHESSGAILTVAVTTRKVAIDFGVIEFTMEKRVSAFLEKPSYDYHVSMGVYVMNREILSHIPEGIPFGFDDLMRTLLAKGCYVNVFPYDGFWLDIGRPEDYDQANTDILPQILQITQESPGPGGSSNLNGR